MKTTMSVNQYKQYKNGELTELDIKLQNIGIDTNGIINNTTAYIKENKRLIFTLAVLTTGFIASELALSSLAVNTLDFKPEICLDLFSQNNNGVYGI
jgi:hypothetical protein